MTKIKMHLKRAMKRSQKAFDLYYVNKYYYQALRIHKANEQVYILLNEYIKVCDDKDLDRVLDYIFHLEDWFEQFKELENENPRLVECFVFERFADSPAFPNNFIKTLNN